ncbi:MAG: flavin reductase family protein [Salinisphaera sp.]|nr:flavin reductase family protein [Salinisphaera sp.]
MTEPDLAVPTGGIAQEDGEVSGAALRKALGRFVSGVTVVTTAVDGEPHGMTANAFTSVSLDPPLVLVSIATQARMDRAIKQSGHYGISILCRSQEPLSLHFAGARDQSGLVRFVWRHGVPLLDGALVHLACSVHDTHPAGDHSLHVGRVDGLWYDYGDPLVFFTGSFRALEIVKEEHPWGF